MIIKKKKADASVEPNDHSHITTDKTNENGK